MQEELEITIDKERIGKYILSGEIYFTIGTDGTYCDLPTDDELIDYELYDEDNNLFEVDTDKMEELILQTAIRIYKSEREYSEDESTSDDWVDPDEHYPDPTDGDDDQY